MSDQEPRKPRSDSKLDAMKPEGRVLELRDKLLANVSHRAIIDWLAVECGVAPCSSSMLSRFYQRHCAPVVRERRKFSVVKAEALGDAMKKDPVSWDEKIVERTKQLAFEFLSGDEVDPEAVKMLLDALTKANKQNLDRDKFELVKKKAAFADAVKEAAENRQGGITAEDMKEIERKLKLL